MSAKKVLAIFYSQSGQLKEIINNFCEPFIENGDSVENVQISLKDDYSFPWTGKRFFGTMPECVFGAQAELEPFTLKEQSYDLIVLGYQAWFLSPSIAFNSLISYPSFKGVLKNSSVITITGARNMWINAFGVVKKVLREVGANHVGTIALVDRHMNLISIFTIFHWMLRGKKDRYLGFFPKPGVSAKDIESAKKFGVITLPYLKKNEWSGLKEELLKNKAAVPEFHLMLMESKAAMMFRIWARFIIRRKKQNVWLAVFKYYLLIALFIFSPIVFMIDLLFFKPFLPEYIRAKKASCLQLD